MEEIGNSIREFVETSGFQAFILAFVILVFTAIAVHLISRLIRRALSSDGLTLPSSSILINVVRVTIWVFSLSLILSWCFKIDVQGLLAALGVGGILVSLGLQDTVKNLFGGLQVTLMKIVKPGDHIIVGATEGIVSDVSLRHTVVNDYEGTTHLIPNAVLNNTEVQKIEPHHLVSTMISFVNDTRDIDTTIREMELLAKQAVEEVAELEKDPWILLTQIGEYGTWAKLRFVLKDVDHAREARDAALRAISPYTRINSSELLLSDGKDK